MNNIVFSLVNNNRKNGIEKQWSVTLTFYDCLEKLNTKKIVYL